MRPPGGIRSLARLAMLCARPVADGDGLRRAAAAGLDPHRDPRRLRELRPAAEPVLRRNPHPHELLGRRRVRARADDTARRVHVRARACRSASRRTTRWTSRRASRSSAAPLDFTAVTDHAEFLGEIRTCLTVGPAGLRRPALPGRAERDREPARGHQRADPAGRHRLPADHPEPPTRRGSASAVPATPTALTQAALVWQDELDAAEEFYDRTAACDFTTFPGLRVDEQPERLQPAPQHHLPERRGSGAAHELLRAAARRRPLRRARERLPRSPGNCDFVAIPAQLERERRLDVRDRRTPTAARSPRPTRNAAPATSRWSRSSSTRAARSVIPRARRTTSSAASSSCSACSSSRPRTRGLVPPGANFVRNGARRKACCSTTSSARTPSSSASSAAPTDTAASPGGVVEEDFGTNGHLGVRDGSAENILSQRRARRRRDERRRSRGAVGGGELARRALRGDAPPRGLRHERHAADRALLRRAPAEGRLRRTRRSSRKATPTACRWAARSGPSLGRRSPRFAVMAMQDPGGGGEPSTPLQRIQIVKGWVDDDGEAHEKVFEVAGDAHSDASVDLDTCTPTGSGAASLCAVWTDPSFRPEQRAFYYARVLENPVCRWSTRLCNSLGVDCSNPGSVPDDLPGVLHRHRRQDDPGARVDVADLLPTRGIRHERPDRLRQRHHGRTGCVSSSRSDACRPSSTSAPTASP